MYVFFLDICLLIQNNQFLVFFHLATLHLFPPKYEVHSLEKFYLPTSMINSNDEVQIIKQQADDRAPSNQFPPRKI